MIKKVTLVQLALGLLICANLVSIFLLPTHFFRVRNLDCVEQSELCTLLKEYFRNTKPPAATEGPWLTIGIPSRPRPHAGKHKELLQAVLESLREPQVPTEKQAKVLIINNSPLPGTFPALAEIMSNMSKYPHVEIEDNPFLGTMMELRGEWKRQGKIPAQIQQHMFDVLSALMVVYRRIPVSSLFMFHEDDFFACPGALAAVRSTIAEVHRRFPYCTSQKTVGDTHTGLKGWRGIRFTYGMAGIVVPAMAIPSIAMYMLAGVERVPVDHALVEWFLGAGHAPWQSDACPFFIMRRNHFEHWGTNLSTFKGRAHPDLPLCGSNLNNTIRGLFRKGEFFDSAQCPDDTIYPCAATVQARRNAQPALYDEIPLW